MNSKAFTLIELLVVVAIIGILAAVGVVAYNGYTSAAKVNTTKTIHKKVLKFITSELMKCELGEATIFDEGNYGAISCTGNSSKSVNNKGAMRLRDALYNNAKIFNDKNPYDSTRLAVQRDCTSPGWCLGNINLEDSDNGTVLNFKTCFKEPCSKWHDGNGYWDKIQVP